MADITYHGLINSHPAAFWPRLTATLKLWRRRIVEREQLARLDERELRDIGVSAATVAAELDKPFWRA
jgi:uncharacterized protein YjiS (DUF1127 family)